MALFGIILLLCYITSCQCIILYVIFYIIFISFLLLMFIKNKFFMQLNVIYIKYKYINHDSCTTILDNM